MDVNELADKLPTVPRSGMREWIEEDYNDELGGYYCIFNRTEIFIEEMPIAQTMYPEDWEKYDAVNKYHHAAECRCTACGERFYTGWYKYHPDEGYGILMFVGDDGMNYDGYIPETETDSPDYMAYIEGQHIVCPYCGENIRLIHKSRLRHGRTYQILAVSVEVVEGYTVLMTWLCSRHFEDYRASLSIAPFEALVIDGRSFHRFTKAKTGFYRNMMPNGKNKWEQRNYHGEDLSYRRYYDYGSWGHKKCGAVVWCNVPNLDETTGEKTGLYDYIVNGDEHVKCPFAYMKLWRKHPNVENIVKSNWRNIVDTELYQFMVAENHYYSPTYDVDTYTIDYRENKPHRMLGIKKEDMKCNYGWSYEELFEYQLYNGNVEKISACEFDDYIDFLCGLENVSICTRNLLDGNEHWKLEKVANYLDKQKEKFNLSINEGIQLLDDYRDMLYEVNRGHGIPESEFFPRDLREAHDRLVETKKAKEHKEYKAKFRKLAKKYSKLAYTDGDLCIRVAKSESELINEGRTLKHCVGGYGTKHCNETDVIFFVRHYRRPERSYFTLDISFYGKEPREVQLHGYKNENVYNKRTKQIHTIPKKVRDFCDKWEKEVLAEWYAEQKHKKSKKKVGKTA